MNVKGKAERTKQFIIEQSAPILNLKGIAGYAEATKGRLLHR
jgi:TetR/AcrR family transcriptional repressor of nem operon